jgi:hypothetical protein
MDVLSWLHIKFSPRKRTQLVFLNRMRAYNETKHCVTFWGFDESFEISFELPDEELQRICAHTGGDENSVLYAFDRNREAAECMAAKAHKGGGQRHHILRSSIA